MLDFIETEQRQQPSNFAHTIAEVHPKMHNCMSMITSGILCSLSRDLSGRPTVLTLRCVPPTQNRQGLDQIKSQSHVEVWSLHKHLMQISGHVTDFNATCKACAPTDRAFGKQSFSYSQASSPAGICSAIHLVKPQLPLFFCLS